MSSEFFEGIRRGASIRVGRLYYDWRVKRMARIVDIEIPVDVSGWGWGVPMVGWVHARQEGDAGQGEVDLDNLTWGTTHWTSTDDLIQVVRRGHWKRRN